MHIANICGDPALHSTELISIREMSGNSTGISTPLYVMTDSLRSIYAAVPDTTSITINYASDTWHIVGGSITAYSPDKGLRCYMINDRLEVIQ